MEVRRGPRIKVAVHQFGGVRKREGPVNTERAEAGDRGTDRLQALQARVHRTACRGQGLHSRRMWRPTPRPKPQIELAEELELKACSDS